MIPDITPGARVHLKSMYDLAACHPCEMVAAEALFTLANIIDRAEGRMSEDDRASLLAIGSTFVETADAEIKAMVGAMFALKNARKK